MRAMRAALLSLAVAALMVSATGCVPYQKYRDTVSALDRAKRIVSECRQHRAEAVVLARIPGASHCPYECGLIREELLTKTGLPVVELEIPPVCDSMLPTLRTRLQATVEIALTRRES